jgi:hypothetical protein
MVPPEDKSIRNIQINREGDEVEPQENEAEDYRREAYEPPKYRGRGSKMSTTWWMWVLGLILLVFIILSLTPLLTKANIEITPRHQAVDIDGSFEASSTSFPAEGSDLFYDIMSVEKIGTAEVAASGEEEVSEKASGRITVYNEFSAEPERLIANTRFEASNGSIFRISEAITIPGYSTSNGDITPGSIEVTVTADEAGSDHNVAAGRFTVPGLEGDERFDKVYARSTSAISGGFVGVKNVADEDDVVEARETLRASLEDEAEEELSSQIPDDFIFFIESSEIEFESMPTEEAGEDNVLVKERMIVRVPIFNKTDIAEFIAAQTIGSYEGEEVKLVNTEELSVSLISEEETDGLTLNLSIEGSPVVVWVVDLDSIHDDLLGLEKREVENVLSNYPAILEANINLSPFWKRTLPDDPEKLTVSEIIPNNFDEQ